MGDDTTYKIDLEDSINVDIGQLNLDLNDTITYNVASPGGGSSGATYGDGRFDPSWYGTNDPGTGYTVNIGTEPIVTESCFKTDVEEMSKDYPGLDKAWRNFKLFYDICKSDFDKKKETDA
tara:strand:+ start:177 stop:539 length:363 start_codon:yes stop_codon:yes gene_type:complete